MKASELRDLSDDELRAQVDEAKEEYFNLRFQEASSQLEDFNRLRVVRRNVARVKTIMRERELEAEQHGE